MSVRRRAHRHRRGPARPRLPNTVRDRAAREELLPSKLPSPEAAEQAQSAQRALAKLKPKKSARTFQINSMR